MHIENAAAAISGEGERENKKGEISGRERGMERARLEEKGRKEGEGESTKGGERNKVETPPQPISIFDVRPDIFSMYFESSLAGYIFSLKVSFGSQNEERGVSADRMCLTAEYSGHSNYHHFPRVDESHILLNHSQLSDQDRNNYL